MTEQTTPHRPGTSRRDFLRRGAIVGGTLVWAAPAVQTLARPAFAQNGTPPPCTPEAMSLEDVSCSSVRLAPGGDNAWRASVTVDVEDDCGDPVEGATVSGSISYEGSGASPPSEWDCTTDATGQCTFSVTLHQNRTSATFTATSVTHAVFPDLTENQQCTANRPA